MEYFIISTWYLQFRLSSSPRYKIYSTLSIRIRMNRRTKLRHLSTLNKPGRLFSKETWFRFHGSDGRFYAWMFNNIGWKNIYESLLHLAANQAVDVSIGRGYTSNRCWGLSEKSIDFLTFEVKKNKFCSDILWNFHTSVYLCDVKCTTWTILWYTVHSIT